MSAENAEQFNLLTRDILRILIDACPTQVELNAEKFKLEKGSFETPSGFIGGFYKSTPQEKFLTDTLQWLTAEGYIRAGDHRDYYVATLQTLKLYGSVPNALSA
ncbi:hypothetical protein CLU80_5225 [Pseudomonas sp. 29]|jgi:hypothetical protein|uniref:hypothetical protein n=1 Tax=Pseudomonas sp. 29 TaxID=2035197 RepID=UPI000C18BFFB|nr:hypothetical protein [Pseudomonas sp. 29]PIF52742.1 hypothetical protein CLU80_5225 [Pseudomonas sp. 29]